MFVMSPLSCSGSRPARGAARLPHPPRLALMALAAMIGLCPAAADAQAPAGPSGPPQPPARQRPFRGLFGGPQDPTRPQSLEVTLNAYGGYDDNVIAGQGGVGADPRAQVGSGLVGGGASVAYSKASRRSNFSATFGSDTRYYPERATLSASSYNGGAGLSYELSRRSRITLAQSIAYMPFYQLGVFPGVGDPVLGGGVPSNLDLAVTRQPSWLSNSSVDYEQQLGRRSSLTLMYAYTRQDFAEVAQPTDPDVAPLGSGDLSYQMAGFRFRRSLSRYLALRLGYQYRKGTFGFPADTQIEGHNIDVGVDYARTLSFSRRTSLTFSTGSAIVQTTDQDRTYRVTGNATLSHEFTRTWQGQLTYLRDVGFFGNFNQPIFSDSFNSRLRGSLGDRIQLTLNAGYLTGQLGLVDNESSNFKTFTGSASMMYALTELLGIDVSYSYFDYSFSQAASAPPGLRPRFDRNSVRAGLTLWLPLIR